MRRAIIEEATKEINRRPDGLAEDRLGGRADDDTNKADQ